MHLPIGTLLQGGRYEIIRYISSGGFGCTYEARDTKFKNIAKSLAIKEFFVKDFCNRDAATNCISVATQGKAELVEKLRAKFLAEAAALYGFNHPNIVRVTDTFEENGTAYYVMEYIDGCSLANIVEKNGPLSEEKALGYIRQVADALKYVHSQNYLHLDVKPHNIMVDGNDRAVLIDFGVSKQYDEANGANTSTLVGSTPGYAPLEQSGSGIREFSPTTDIYSLGATLFKLVTGMNPPVASEVNENGLPTPVGVSSALFHAIETAMQPRRKDRPQNIDEFLSLLSENGKVKTENGKLKDESDGETELNGNVKVERRNEKEYSAGAVISNVGEKSHSANNEILPPYSRQNDKDGKEEVERRNEKEHSVGVVISNESEKSQKNKPGKSLLLIFLLLLIAVSGAWFLLGGAVSSDAPKRDSAKDSVTKKTAVPIAVPIEEAELVENTEPVASLPTGKHNGHEYVDLGLPSGLKWATCNVGASSPSDYGDYYAWGEISTKSSYDENNSTTSGKEIGDIAGNLTYDVARAEWHGSWRLPTKKEFQELLDYCTWEWTTQDGVNGYRVTSQINGNSIFLPAAGFRHRTSSHSQGSDGYYWSATPYENYANSVLVENKDGGIVNIVNELANFLKFDEGGRGTHREFRKIGFRVRPVFQNN